MARGKDGFDSLLVKSEGGLAEEIVSEENGILISMMLRQYFLSLKILGQWKMWGDSMDRHWKCIHKDVHESHPVIEPCSTKPASNCTSAVANLASLEKLHAESDEETNSDELEHARINAERQDREMNLIRKVARKWRRLAGLSGHPKCCDSMCEEELHVDWTKVSILVMRIISLLMHSVGYCPTT